MTNKHQGVSADLDTQIEQILRIAEQAEGVKGYGVTPAFQAAIKNLIAQEVQAARIEERKLVSELMDIGLANLQPFEELQSKETE